MVFGGLKMKTSNSLLIEKEVLKRKKKQIHAESVIGAELRNARIRLCRTLVATAYKICSVSYLCKIERNQAQPNQKVLYMLCENLNVTKKKIEVIYSLEDKLNDITCAFLKDDYKMIEAIHSDIDGLDNFRSDIIEFIYYIYIDDSMMMDHYFKKVLPMISSLSDYDLMYYILFTALYNFKNGDFTEGLENLNSVSKMSCNDSVLYAIKLFKFYNLCAMNHSDTPDAYTELYKYLVDMGLFKRISEISYYMAIYYAKKNAVVGFDKMYDRVNSDSKIKLNFYRSYYINKVIPPMNKNYDLFAKCIINLDDEEYVSKILSTVNNIRLDFDYYYLDYLMKSDINEKIDYIENIIIPWLDRSGDEYLKDYFLKEIINLSLYSSRYKKLSDIGVKILKR